MISEAEPSINCILLSNPAKLTIFFDISIDLESISIEINFDSLSILDAIRIAE